MSNDGLIEKITSGELSAASLDDEILLFFVAFANNKYRAGEPVISDERYDHEFFPEVSRRFPDHELVTRVEPEPEDGCKMEEMYKLMRYICLSIILFLVGCGGGGGSVPVPPISTSLYWNPPLTDTDGFPITIQNYTIYCGKSSGKYEVKTVVTAPPAKITDSMVNYNSVYYCVVTATSTMGVESLPSNEVTNR